MPTETPPATPYDHKPAYNFRESLLDKCDGETADGRPYWHGWALLEAYMAGRAEAVAETETEYRGE